MFDLFDPGKLLIVGIVALIVIGPKELPRVLRTVGQVTGRMRRMAAEFQAQFNEAMREAELEDVKKEFAAINEAAKVNVAFDPATLTQHENAKSLEAGPIEAEKPAAAALAASEEIKIKDAAPDVAEVRPAAANGGAPVLTAPPEAAAAHQPLPAENLAHESHAP